MQIAMPAMRVFLRLSLIATALCGCVASVLLLFMTSEGSFAASLCSPRPGVNCADVLNSPWASVGGVPTSLLGLLYYSAFAIWYIGIGLPNHAGRRWHVFVLCVNALGLGWSAWLILVMKLQLQTWCSWCLAAHATNGLMFILGVVARPRRPATAPDAAREPAWPTLPRVAQNFIPGFLGCGLGVVGLIYALQQSKIAQLYRVRYSEIIENPDYLTWQHGREARVDMQVRGDEPGWGSPAAPHTVIVFSDFQCPKCRELDAFIPQVVARYPNQIRFVYKHYPLCNECNKSFPDSYGCMHKFACRPAYAAEAVRRAAGPAAAVKYHELLFANSHALATLDLAELATRVGVSAQAFDAALKDPATQSRIAEDTMLGKALAVEGSADVYLDGQRLKNWRMMDRKNPKQMHLEASLRLWGRLLGILPPASAPMQPTTRPAT